VVERTWSAEPALRHPRRFLALAASDVRRGAGTAVVLAGANIRRRHRSALLGYVWLLLPTLATAVVWIYVQRAGIMPIGTSGIPYSAHVLAGVVLWQVFVEALNVPLVELGAKRTVLARTGVLPEGVVGAGVLEVLFTCAIRVAVVLVVLVVLGVHLGPSLLLAPLGITALVLLGVSIGLVVTPLGLLFVDVERAMTLLTSVWFLLTPVIYARAPHGFLRFNPVTPVLGTTRGWLTGEPGSGGFLLVLGGSVVALAVGWTILRVARPHIVGRLG
jgi:lipopolysaccharide transport system permease protein